MKKQKQKTDVAAFSIDTANMFGFWDWVMKSILNTKCTLFIQ